MKTFISLLFIPVLLFLSSCDSSLINKDGNKKQKTTSIQKPPDTSRAQVSSTRKELWQQFKKVNGSSWRIRWSEQTGLPRTIFLGLTKKAYKGSGRPPARAFLADHVALLGFGSLKHLRFVRAQKYMDIRYVTFNETVHDVPVYEAQYVVQVKLNGQVAMVNGTYYPDIKVTTNPSVSKSKALQTARADLNVGQHAKLKTTAVLVIYRGKKQFHLAWKLTLFSKNPSVDMLYMVDAHSEHVLYKFSLIMT